MRHLIVSREYPPAAYPPGGIGVYVQNIARLLAEAGETVHVIGQLWEGAPERVEELCGGRLVVHRVPVDEPLVTPGSTAAQRDKASRILDGLARSAFPSQAFAWQAGLLAESLVQSEGIDTVEAQDWEAPLYYFQLRRALGLGPDRQPPCFVHMHSPTELIFRYNEWDLGRPDYLPAKRLEDYSITAADALLCPSRFLARQVEALYSLAADSVSVIPYPVGAATPLERGAGVWQSGTICFVGRIEPRKGVIEWVDAAVEVSRDRPGLEFEFIGADTPRSGVGRLTVQEYIEARIPESMRPQFRFFGVRSRSELGAYLARARLAVVSSRWENFPNTCIEAMGSGLPVLTSPHGGMTEMVDDGKTGWIASAGSPEGLAEGLCRALDAGANSRAAIGAAAAVAIRKICNNAETIDRHIAFRARVATLAPTRSTALAPDLPHAPIPATRRARPFRRRPSATTSDRHGVGLVISAFTSGPLLDDCIDHVLAQTEAPAAVAFVADANRSKPIAAAVRRAREAGWHVVEYRGHLASGSWNAGLEPVLRGPVVPLGVALLRPEVRLAPEFVAHACRALEHRSDLGILSPWTQWSGEVEGILIRPCPTFPYQWASNDVGDAAVFRTEALVEALPLRPGLERGFESWDLANAVLAAGWIGVTYPDPLVVEQVLRNGWTADLARVGQNQMREVLLTRFPALVAADATDLALILQSALSRSDPAAPSPARGTATTAPPTPQTDPVSPGNVLRWPIRDQAALARRALANPGYSARWLAWHAGRMIRRAVNRVIGRDGGAE